MQAEEDDFMWNDIMKIIEQVKKQRWKHGDKEVYIVSIEQLQYLEKYMISTTALRKFLFTVLNSAKSSRMFNIVGETWNPITGCTHYCRYCWARQLALTKLKNTERYRQGFKPRFNEEELKKGFKEGVVFVSDMGDIFSPGVRREWVVRVIKHISKFPNTYFLFLTKNPQKYKEFTDVMPPNAILGATIETNRDNLYLKYRISHAPLPSLRYRAMKELDWPLKFVSIEPILDFDLNVFVEWIKEINPFMVYVGYDNYEWRLPEPPLRKTLQLIDKLSEFTLVVKKTIRHAWNEVQTITSYSTSKGKIRKSREIGEEYERFKQYLSLMHEIAVEIMKNLGGSDRHYVESFFIKYYPTIKEHYWTLKKLFSLAMYIPMFLQIGLAAIEKRRFDGIIYVDTHAGPGLAKVDKGMNDIVLGSPLLALIWPKVIGENLKRFRKVSVGFDKLFLIERDIYTYNVLSRIVKNIDCENAVLIRGDSNIVLNNIKKHVEKDYKNPLVLMFIDPFGEFSSQLLYSTLFEFTRDWAVDIIINVNAPSLARGLEGKKKNISELRSSIIDLWGDLCETPRAKEFSKLCECFESPSSCDVTVNDVLNAYIHRLEIDGYRFIDTIPVEFRGKVLYYLLFASKGKRSYDWLGNYIRYLRLKAPKDYETLRNLWLQATGKQKDLTKFMKHVT